ncbi:hypothetical protein Aperf_G00000091895 [Anoplocephala perfoliata]
MENEEQIITLKEYVDAEVESSARILGGAENGDDECTYPLGYLPRQAVYLCKTCYDITGERAGICFACSENCHEDHEIIELYTKRNFRCDCGNAKFNGASACQLFEDKDQQNALNAYNHNFEGLFCACKRPYPDPENPNEEEMCQCCICEDWFHLEHIGIPRGFKPAEHAVEVVCTECVKKHPFLWLFYYNHSKSELKEKENDEEEHPAKKPRLDETLTSPDNTAGSMATELQSEKACRIPSVLSSCGVTKLDASTDEISKLEVDGLKFPSPLLWQNDWRSETLCSCDSCKSRLKERDIDFLLDQKDKISEYMDVGLKRYVDLRDEQERAMERVLRDMPRPAAIEFAHNLVHFRESLAEFLLKESSKGVITEARVLQFFEKFRGNEEEG